MQESRKNTFLTEFQYRKKEIELTERAQKSVQESVDRGDYDGRTAAWILQGRDSKAPEERRAILRALEQQMDNPKSKWIEQVRTAGNQCKETGIGRKELQEVSKNHHSRLPLPAMRATHANR